MANEYALIPLVSFFITIFLGALIYSRNTDSLINKLYLALTIASGLQALIELGYCLSRNPEEAGVIMSIDIIWPLHNVAGLYFMLSLFEKQRWLKSPVTHILALGIAVLFFTVDASTDLLVASPEKTQWGYQVAPFRTDTFLSIVAATWAAVITLIQVAIPLQVFWKTQSERKRKQAKMVFLANTLGFLYFSLISMMKADIWIFELPNPFSIASTIYSLIYAYAIWRYELLALSPVTTAQHIVATMSDSLLLINLDKTIAAGNQAASDMLGWTDKELNGKFVGELFAPNAPVPVWVHAPRRHARHIDVTVRYFETKVVTRLGNEIPVSLATSPLIPNTGFMMGYLIIARDISDRIAKDAELDQYKNQLEELVEKRTNQLLLSNKQLTIETEERQKVEQERSKLEEQLQHAQKMEAIGRLAGGVAHDFNNLLFVIHGYAESLLEETEFNDPTYADIQEIIQASERAASLTKQLLAFSRKQTITAEIIEPNEILQRAQSMLSRLIGENIKLSYTPNDVKGLVNMDPSQLDQILVNLVVNARDAMPQGGNIDMLLQKVSIDENNPLKNPEALFPHYILLSVTDTGYGMDKETLDKIFEPFFTTKGIGKGTGLGLSTLYGIVKQNNGFVEVDSAPGKGSSFRIFLPEYGDNGQVSDEKLSVMPAPIGGETILLVEDEDQVRRLASRQLRNKGYVVLEASNAAEAITIFQAHRKEIDLLLTDIVMPGMSGKQLSEQLLVHDPQLKTLFMSGYNEEVVDRHGHLDSSIPLLQKPFSAKDLSSLIRKVLDD